MDNPLKQIFSSFFGGGASSDSVIGIDIGSSSIKVVQLKRKNGKAVLETYGALSLGPYAKVEAGRATNLSVEDIVTAFKETLKESSVTTNVGEISIPVSSSLIFTISLPITITEDQFASIVPVEARKYIPIPMNEITLDWFVIPKEPEAFEEDINYSIVKKPETKTDILVVAIHNDILIKYQDIIRKTGLQSNSFELEIFSNVRSSFSHDVAPVLLVDFGASKTKLSIVEAGIVKFSHVVNRGSQDITSNISSSLNISFDEAERMKKSVGLDENENKNIAEISRLFVDYIFSETNNVVLAFEKKYNKNVSKVVFTGGGSMLRGLIEYASSSFHTEVLYSNPFSKVEAPSFLEPILKASGPEFSVAVGLALKQLS